MTLKNATILLNGRPEVINAIESGIFPKEKQRKGLTSISDRVAKISDHKVFNHKQLKILIPKQMLQRLPIALAQVKEGNTSETLLNEIRRIIYSLYRAREVTKKACNNIMHSIKLQNRINIIFMNSKNSKTSDSHRLSLNLSEKVNLKRIDKYVALSNMSIYYTWENIKTINTKTINLMTWNGEFELPDESYSVSDIQYYFEYIFKKHGEKTDNPSLKMVVNKIKNRITFNKIKIGLFPALLTPETIKLFGSNESKITQDKNGENVLNLEITEVHCNIINNNYQQDLRVLYAFIPNKSFGQLIDVSLEISYL